MERITASRPAETFNTEFLETLSRTLGLSVAITGELGRILWVNERIGKEFDGVFDIGRAVDDALAQATVPDTLSYPYVIGPFGVELGEQVLRGGSLRRSRLESTSKVYRYFKLPLSVGDGDSKLTAHCLLDITPEKRLFETYRNNLHQLSSMKEIIDLLYESMSTSEVINLILVAVTARQGFGFNRAFFLDEHDARLRGRLGIGPASAEEAHRIWTRLEDANPSLKETLHELAATGEPPNPATQALALRVVLPLGESAGESVEGGIGRACLDSRPALITRSPALPPAEQELFEMLGVDEIAVVPLRIRDRLAGVLLADNCITRRAISEDDLSLLKTFSGYAALALERSSLYDDLKHNLDRLREANTDLQSNQKRLLQAEKLSALGSLAASVSHEIRNPLVAIGGLARSVLDDRQLGDDSREALTIIVSEVRRLERFLKETLDFAKPSAPVRQDVDLCSLVRDVVSTFREEIQRARLELELSVPESPLIAAVAPDSVKGVLSNLIKNAREALGAGGRIRVSLRMERPESGGADYKGLAEIEVADTGPGIPKESRDFIFEPFFTTKKDGTGIGLAISKQNIRSLGGSINFDSNPPFNTVFRIQLPVVVRSS